VVATEGGSAVGGDEWDRDQLLGWIEGPPGAEARLIAFVGVGKQMLEDR
jgi:hypothetical protein